MPNFKLGRTSDKKIPIATRIVIKNIIFCNHGGFQLIDLIIPELKSHVIPYKFKSSHWLKLQHSEWRANLVKDFFKNEFSTNEST